MNEYRGSITYLFVLGRSTMVQLTFIYDSIQLITKEPILRENNKSFSLLTKSFFLLSLVSISIGKTKRNKRIINHSP